MNRAVSANPQRLRRWRGRLAATALLVATPLAAADQAAGDGGLSQGARNAGSAVGQAIHTVWQGAKTAGLAIGHTAADAGKAVGHAAAEGGRRIGHAAAEGGRALGRAVRGDR